MLSELWKMGKNKDKGFDVVNGILINVHFREPGIECARVVVPKCRRWEIMIMDMITGG